MKVSSPSCSFSLSLSYPLVIYASVAGEEWWWENTRQTAEVCHARLCESLLGGEWQEPTWRKTGVAFISMHIALGYGCSCCDLRHFLLHWYKDLLGKCLQLTSPDKSAVCSRDTAEMANMTLQTQTGIVCVSYACQVNACSHAAMYAHVDNCNIYSCLHYHKTNTDIQSTGLSCGVPARL